MVICMGQAITQQEFSEEEHQRFRQRLEACLEALTALCARPGFGEGPATIGAELEVNLIDAAARPAPVSAAVLAHSQDPRLTYEVDRFNLELNCRPLPLAGRAFSGLAAELGSGLAELRRAAQAEGARVVPVGILPTLLPPDLGPEALTDLPRYHALNHALRARHRGPFQVRIHGDEPLHLVHEDVTLEGATTSFQVHLRVAPADFARAYNAALLSTIPALAACGNAPLFLGHRLWEETRIALFKQAVDERPEPEGGVPRVAQGGFPAARVTFGHGFARGGVVELMEETCALWTPLLAPCGEEDPLAVVRGGGVPALGELRLHNGTVWRWVRPIYDDADGGHLRLELRALPAGPTVVDMAAGAAFQLGVLLGLLPQVERLVSRVPFGCLHHSFYRAAQQGLQAELLWPSERGASPVSVPARELVLALLPVARAGLTQAGVDAAEISEHLGLIEERVRSGQTGARWQRQVFERLLSRHPREEALRRLVERYHELSLLGEPVHRWSLAGDLSSGAGG